MSKIQIVILGSGSREVISGEGKDNHRNSSMLLTSRTGINILFDCTPQFYEQMQTFAEDTKSIDYVVLSHGNNEAIGGISQLKHWLKENNQKTKPIIFMEKETENRIKEQLKDISHIEIKNFLPYEIMNLNHLKIVPFRITEESLSDDKNTTDGFRIDDKIVYAKDIKKTPEKSLPYLDKSDLLIIDAEWFGKGNKGHMNVDESLTFAKKFGAKKVVLIQSGVYPTYDKAVKEINKYLGEAGQDRVVLGYDGLSFNISDSFQKIDNYLVEIREGVYSAPNHIEEILQNKKKYIVEDKKQPKIIDKLLYLVDDEHAYGIIKLGSPHSVNCEDFSKYENLHLISDEERRKLYPQTPNLRNSDMFLYPFVMIDKFENPRKIKTKKSLGIFVKDIKFLKELPATNSLSNTSDKESDDLLKEFWGYSNEVLGHV